MASLAQQTYAFLMTILAGGIIGLLFDGYRVVRSLLKPKQLATAMTDLLYWIVVTPTVFALLLAGNWGELRFYVLLGLAVGLLLYFQTLSAAVIWFLMSVIKGTGRILGGITFGLARVVMYPFVALGGLFSRTGRRRSPFGRPRWRPNRSVIPFPRFRMAWQRLSLSRIFGRFG